jgi:hypothetical protein
MVTFISLFDLFTQRVGTEALDQLTHTPHRLDALLFGRKPGVQSQRFHQGN